VARATVLGTAASVAVVVGAVLGGTAFVNRLPGAWFFGPATVTPVSGAAPPPSPVALFLVYGGLVVLARCWLGLWRSLPDGTPVRRVAAVIAVWSLPFVVAPPLFSRDVYSYAGLGEMVSRHISPYLFGTGVLGGTPFNILAGPLWANTPSPYGPTFLGLDGFLTTLGHHDVLADLVLLRLVAVAGVVLAGAGVASLARSHGRDPARAVLLGVGSPLVLTALVGGAHNDALMAGLLVAGLAVARRVGPVPGIVLCSLAAGVKAPAILGVAFIGWNWPGPSAGWRSRVGHGALAGALAGATLAIVSTATGLGWGWLRTLGAADRVSTGVTPVDATAKILRGMGLALHLQLSLAGTRTVVATLALVAAGALGCWLLVRSPRLGTELALGLALVALALCGPILWAWYLTWGLIVLAPVARGPIRTAAIALTLAGTAIGPAAVKAVGAALVAAPLAADVVLLAAMATLCLVPLAGRSAGSATLPGGGPEGTPPVRAAPSVPAGAFEPASAD
jgi:hypothetical protein